jgi:hypothetical protein
MMILLECVRPHERLHKEAVYIKYAERKFKGASRFVEEYMSRGHYVEITEENTLEIQD